MGRWFVKLRCWFGNSMSRVPGAVLFTGVSTSKRPPITNKKDFSISRSHLISDLLLILNNNEHVMTHNTLIDFNISP